LEVLSYGSFERKHYTKALRLRADILLASFNGERFLREQMDSIIAQSHDDWHLIIRDDGSTDSTLEILREYSEKYKSKLTIIDDGLGGLGARGNFSRLMEYSTAPYILFSDQDDIWEKDKVKDMLTAIQQAESKNQVSATETPEPTCVFSDLAMINENGELIAPSLWEKESIDPTRVLLGQLLVQNVPYGCTMIINRSLLDLATPIDGRALLHDHWLALLSAAAGRILSFNKATIRHRIHDTNASRGENPIRKEREQSVSAVITNKNFNHYFSKLQEQALSVKERLLERNIANGSAAVLDDFINLRRKGLLTRKYLMIERGFLKHSRRQSLKWLIRI